MSVVSESCQNLRLIGTVFGQAFPSFPRTLQLFSFSAVDEPQAFVHPSAREGTRSGFPGPTAALCSFGAAGVASAVLSWPTHFDSSTLLLYLAERVEEMQKKELVDVPRCSQCFLTCPSWTA